VQWFWTGSRSCYPSLWPSGLRWSVLKHIFPKHECYCGQRHQSDVRFSIQLTRTTPNHTGWVHLYPPLTAFLCCVKRLPSEQNNRAAFELMRGGQVRPASHTHTHTHTHSCLSRATTELISITCLWSAEVKVLLPAQVEPNGPIAHLSCRSCDTQGFFLRFVVRVQLQTVVSVTSNNMTV